MIISKDSNGRIVGWRETYVSADEIVDVSVVGNINTIRLETEQPERSSPRPSSANHSCRPHSQRATSEQRPERQQVRHHARLRRHGGGS